MTSPITEIRDVLGRLKVSYFVGLMRYYIKQQRYDPERFKDWVQGLGVLRKADWDTESNGYAKWKHRIDRARQKVFTGI